MSRSTGPRLRAVAPIALAAVALAASCAHPPKPARVAPRRELSPPPPEPAAIAAKPDLCATAGAEELARIRAVHEEAKKQAHAARPEGGFNPLPEELPAIFTQCFPHERGAFFVTLDWMKPGQQWGAAIDARWSLTHVDLVGRRVSVTPGQTRDNLADTKEQNLLIGGEDFFGAEIGAYDYDLDGVPEILVTLAGRPHEGAGWSRGRVYTWKNGAISIYPPAKDLVAERFEDVDGDKRPDLITKAGFTAPANSCAAIDYTLSGPDFLAHALPDGTFSLTDEVATRAALSACPKAPSPIVQPGDEATPLRMAESIMCARMWGVGSFAILTELDRVCKKFTGSGECKPGACPEQATLQRWAREKPPLSLK